MFVLLHFVYMFLHLGGCLLVLLRLKNVFGESNYKLRLLFNDSDPVWMFLSGGGG